MNKNQSTSNIITSNASRILTRLSKHWSHKLVVEFDKEHSKITFEHAICYLNAQENSLDVIVDAKNSDALKNIQTVVADHLHRMASPEILLIEWQTIQS